MKIIETSLPGLKVIEPKAFGDQRGFFFESFQADRYSEAGISQPFVQDNVSRSEQAVLRGLHFQTQHAQGKLVTVTRGEVFDVAVDIRVGSPTFGKWFGIMLNDQNHKQLWVPQGFAHGFYVMSEVADFHYKCTDYYQPEFEAGIIWSDSDIGIKWPMFSAKAKRPILSDKDSKYGKLSELSENLLPKFNPKAV